MSALLSLNKHSYLVTAQNSLKLDLFGAHVEALFALLFEFFQISYIDGSKRQRIQNLTKKWSTGH